MEYCYIHPKDDELMHYGVKGMHWGIRRYQPYTSSNKRKGGKTGKFIGNNQKLTKDNKDSLLLLAPFAPHIAFATALAASAAASAIKKGVNTGRAKKAIAHINANKNLDPKTGLKKVDKPESVSESMKMINTERQGRKREALVNRQENCTSCAMALTLRQKGYDVRAKEMPTGRGDNKEYMNKIFGAKPTYVDKQYSDSNFSVKKKGLYYMDTRKLTEEQQLARNAAANGANKKHADDVERWAKSQPNQSGQLMLRWGQGGGHATNYEITDGKMVIHDPQSNKTLKGGAMREWLTQSWTSDFYRLDDKNIKNAKMARDMVYH